MLNENLRKEVIKMLVGVFVLSLIMIGIFALLGYFDITVVYGALLGWMGCVANYFFLAVSVQKAVEKGEDKTKGYMSMSYTLRMIFIAVIIVIAIKLPYFNYLATAIPFFFPRFVIMLNNFRVKKGGEAVDRTGDTL